MLCYRDFNLGGLVCSDGRGKYKHTKVSRDILACAMEWDEILLNLLYDFIVLVQ